MGQDDRSETKAFLRLIGTTFWVILGIAFINFLIIMNSLGNDIFKPIQRNIAAVTTVTPIMKKMVIQSPTIEIDCTKKIEVHALNTLANSARVTFINCKKVGRLLNASNDNQGDIFPLKKNSWTSDYISLSPGKNRLSAALGDKIQTIEITREVRKKESPDKAL